MDFKTAIHVDCYNRDLSTGVELSHQEIYGRMIELLGGVETVWKCVPFTLGEIRHALCSDQHLNNLPMRQWDAAAGFVEYVNMKSKTKEMRRIRSPLQILLQKAGVTCYSPAECVCVLKECARLKRRQELNPQ